MEDFHSSKANHQLATMPKSIIMVLLVSKTSFNAHGSFVLRTFEANFVLCSPFHETDTTNISETFTAKSNIYLVFKLFLFIFCLPPVFFWIELTLVYQSRLSSKRNWFILTTRRNGSNQTPLGILAGATTYHRQSSRSVGARRAAGEKLCPLIPSPGTVTIPWNKWIKKFSLLRCPDGAHNQLLRAWHRSEMRTDGWHGQSW